MPYSDFENKDIAKRWITEIAPESVVDVGAGSGTYRKLYDGGHWTAVEGRALYVDEFELDKLYQDIIISDVRYLNPEYLWRRNG